MDARASAPSRADEVRALIAREWLAKTAPALRIGGFTLRPSQRDAVRAVERAIAEFGGALVADPPGTGKTVIALAVARRAERALVVAPATLRAQWLHSAARAERAVEFVSLESLSRGFEVRPASLVIVDEAHHARTPSTKRYRALAALCAGAEVLLLTATPVVNRAGDLHALLALFLGARAESLDADSRSRVVIRREAHGFARPAVHRGRRLQGIASPPGLADAIRALPAPLPAADGAAALALIQISLAMAWGSSFAALDAALRRRIQRADALADSLAQARWPDRRTLAQWIIGDDATQLAMPLLPADPATAPPPDAALLLASHLQAVRELRGMIQPLVEQDSAQRAAELHHLMKAHPDTRVVLFARHAETIIALWRALRGTPGVIAITGARVRAAHGRWTRDEVLRALGPRAKPFRADDARGIRLLLTTDLFAEGVELQGVGIIVHGDGAWNPARFEQRTGRVARLGGAREIIEAHFEMPPDAEAIVRLHARLERKSRVRDRAVREAHARERLDARVAQWALATSARPVHAATAMPHAPIRIACARSIITGFIALLRDSAGHDLPSDDRGRDRDAGTFTLIGARRLRGRWRVSIAPERLRHLIACADGPSRQPIEVRVREARRVLARWCASRAARDLIAHGTADSSTRAARAQIDRILSESSLEHRTALAARTTPSLQVLARATGVGTGSAVQALLSARKAVRADPHDRARGNADGSAHDSARDAAYLSGLETLAASIEQKRSHHRAPTPQRPRLVALLLLEPDNPPVGRDRISGAM